jgi:hypothetical protein
MLKQLGIVKNKQGKCAQVFEKCFPDALTYAYKSPSQYIKRMWKIYDSCPDTNNNINGKIFEYLIAMVCIREKILPIFLEAKVAFVPNVKYDGLFYSEQLGPICMSLKTSLRERYKQADLEAIALKYVHRRALCYLITMDHVEARRVKDKINCGDVIGLNEVIVATDSEFDDFITEMKSYTLISPGPVDVLESQCLVTAQKVSSFLK